MDDHVVVWQMAGSLAIAVCIFSLLIGMPVITETTAIAVVTQAITMVTMRKIAFLLVNMMGKNDRATDLFRIRRRDGGNTVCGKGRLQPPAL